MPEPRRRSALWLTLLAALALPSESIPAPVPPPPLRWPAYSNLHVSSVTDLDLQPIFPVAPAHACAGENLHRYLAKWQRLLLLQEWQISIYCGLPEGSPLDVVGRVNSFPRRRLAFVYVHPASDSIEDTVLHELLHVAVAEMKAGRGSILYDPEERLVQLLSARLLRPHAQ